MAKKKLHGRKAHPKSNNGAAGDKLESLAKSVAEMAFRKKDPEVLIPARMLSNVAFNEKTRRSEERRVGKECRL